MGLLDKIKDLFSGRKDDVKSQIDKGSDQIQKRVGPEHAAKVDDAAEKAKEAVDKLD